MNNCSTGKHGIMLTIPDHTAAYRVLQGFLLCGYSFNWEYCLLLPVPRALIGEAANPGEIQFTELKPKCEFDGTIGYQLFRDGRILEVLIEVLQLTII